MQTFNLDLSAKRVIPLLNAKQRDVGMKIQVKLTDKQKEYSVPEGVTWSVWYSGKSGEGNYTKIDDRDAVEADGSTVTVELIYQMLNNPGEHQMCLVMNGADGTQLGLWNIPYFVEAIPGADSKAANAYYQAFLDAQAKAEEAAGRAEGAAKQIVVDQEYIETQVFSAGQAANTAATAARDAAESERNAKDDADRAAGAAGDAEAAKNRAEEVADSVGAPVSYKAQTLSVEEQGQVIENIGLTVFGVPYSSAAQVFDISAARDGSVKLHLFLAADGYDAVVTGNGAIMDFPSPKVETQNIETGLIDVTITEARPYAEQVQKIYRLYIEKGVTSIGDHFMDGAYSLKHLTFEDSAQVTHLGKNAFANTQIRGCYDFSNLEDITLNGPFAGCPKLDGLTLSGNVETIAAGSFMLCLALKYVDGLTGVTKIEDAAFSYCTSLKQLQIVPEHVSLGDFAFILTSNDAAADGMALTTASWMSQGTLCFVQNEWGNQLESIRRVTAEAVAFPIPESDEQVTDFYHQWGVFPMIYRGKWYSGGHRASGCCGIFCLYHIYNIRHPNAQYDTFYDFIRNEIVPKKIKVTQELKDALEATPNGQILLANRPGVYEVGKMITALDLPMSLDDDTQTWGEIGTSHWGVCEVLGWKATENLFGEYDEGGVFQADPNSGAAIKQRILDELHAGRPVWLEIVAAHGIGHQGHAVTVIGYDKEKGLQIIDSGGCLPADTLPLVYWLPFEALITPHEKSAIWTFNFGEEITMYSINDNLKEIARGISFRIERGNSWSCNSDRTRITIPCSPKPKFVLFRATDATQAAIADIVKNKKDGSKHYMYGGMYQSVKDFDTVTPAKGQDQNSVAHLFTYYSEYSMVVPTVGTAFSEFEETETKLATAGTFCEYIDESNTVRAEYEWTAYYWDE